MSKKYPYEGEDFEIDLDENCRLVITDGKNTVEVIPAQRGGSALFVYRVPGSGGWSAATEEDAIQSACEALIQLRISPSHDELCKRLTDFYDKLS